MKLVHSEVMLSQLHSNNWMMTVLFPEGARRRVCTAKMHGKMIRINKGKSIECNRAERLCGLSCQGLYTSFLVRCEKVSMSTSEGIHVRY